MSEKRKRRFRLWRIALWGGLTLVGFEFDVYAVLYQTFYPIWIVLGADLPILVALVVLVRSEPPGPRVAKPDVPPPLASDSIERIVGGLGKPEQPALEPGRGKTGRTKTKEVRGPKSKLTLFHSPEKLKIPAFYCRCHHPHRVICLECGLTMEEALKKKGQKWVEWAPEMALPVP